MKSLVKNTLLIAATVTAVLFVQHLVSDDDRPGTTVTELPDGSRKIVQRGGNCTYIEGQTEGGQPMVRQTTQTKSSVIKSPKAKSSRRGDFVFIDGKYTGMPVMSCQIPDGSVALANINVDIKDRFNPTRFYIQAVGLKDSIRITTVPPTILTQRSDLALPQQCKEIYDPPSLAAYASGYLCGVYGLASLKVDAAQAFDANDDYSKALYNEAATEARSAGVAVTQMAFNRMFFRYSGMKNGRKMIVVAMFPYFRSVIGNRFTTGLIMEGVTCCSLVEEEKEAVKRMELMSATVRYNQAFLDLLTQLLNGKITVEMENNNRTARQLMQINQELENAYAAGRRASRYNSEQRSAAVARFSDAIRGEEKVANPLTGKATYVSTDYDHCALNSFGDQLYWNGDLDPNANVNFNNVRWEAVK